MNARAVPFPAGIIWRPELHEIPAAYLFTKSAARTVEPIRPIVSKIDFLFSCQGG